MKEDVGAVLSAFPPNRDHLIPILQAVQEKLGYLPPAAMMEVAEYTRVPESEVYGVASFYAFFKFSPSGRNTIRVCRGTACHVRGGARILREIEKKLGLKPGQTSEDLEFSLETVACIGACALAPTMVVNRETYGQLKAQTVIDTIQNAKRS
ncbi:MAG: NADH-quinone oxidoreductase subunit NuoE [Deltaproteobacteria bacterium]|nr:NADH-quinone oxidoreductase subunit NuoE [Deltaproteobacteria bacterium]